MGRSTFETDLRFHSTPYYRYVTIERARGRYAVLYMLVSSIGFIECQVNIDWLIKVSL